MKISTAVETLAALAQENRLSVFRLLVKAGDSGLGAGEISEALNLGKSTLSFHLKELSHAGLVHSERNGRHIIYSLSKVRIQDLLQFLTEDCCQGRPDLCLPSKNKEKEVCC